MTTKTIQIFLQLDTYKETFLNDTTGIYDVEIICIDFLNDTLAGTPYLLEFESSQIINYIGGERFFACVSSFGHSVFNYTFKNVVLNDRIDFKAIEGEVNVGGDLVGVILTLKLTKIK